jgi:WD40 repeat protein
LPNFELVCDRFEAAWRAGRRPRVEDFTCPENWALLTELILIDLDYRRLAGEAPTPDEYLVRFPGLKREALIEIGATTLPAAPVVVPPSHMGRFELRGQLGVGASGTVWRAFDPQLGREVALKVSHPAALQSPAALERWQREAQAVARLRHPHIVTIHEVLSLGGLPILVEEFVAGQSVRQRLAAGRLPATEAAMLAAAAADALAHSHRYGIVHRDIKPANLMIAEDPESPPPGRLVVIDFGLARWENDEQALTLEGQFLGTPAYVSPEQARGDRDVDARSDVYSLGAVLYEMLTGRPPFHGTAQTVVRALLEKAPPRPRHFQRSIPRDLETVCLKAMNKDRERRYQAVVELRDDLRRFLAGQPVRARRAGPIDRAVQWAYRRPTAAALLASSLAAVLVTVGLLLSLNYSARLAAARDDAESSLYFRRVSLAEREWTANNVLQARLDLEDCPEHRRGWEWRYLDHLCRRDLLTIHHPQPNGSSWSVTAVAYSPDGRTLASACRDGSVRLWDAATGAPLGEIAHHAEPAECVAFSPDGRWVVSGGDGSVQSWDLTAKKPGPHLQFSSGLVTSVAFAPDNCRVAVGVGWNPWHRVAPEQHDSYALCWNLDTERVERQFSAFPGSVLAVAFSPDGSRLAAAGGANFPGEPNQPGAVRVWDSRSGAETSRLEGHTGPVSGVAFIDEGDTLATTGRDKTVRLWDVRHGGTLLRVLRGHRDWVTGMALRADGRTLATSGADGAIKVWDLQSGTEVRTIRGHSGAVNAVAFRPDGQRLASVGSDETIKVWDPDADQEAYAYRFAADPVAAVAALPDDRFLAGVNRRGAQGQASAELIVGGHEKTEALTCTDGVLSAFAVNHDASRIAAIVSGRLFLWDAVRRQAVPTADPRLHFARGVAFHPDGSQFAVVGDQVVLVDARTGRVVGAMGQKLLSPVVAFSPNGKFLATGSDSWGLTLWDAADGHEVVSFPAHNRLITAVAFSPDGRFLASAGWDQVVRVWDLAALRTNNPPPEIAVLRGHGRSVLSLCFSPDGRRLITGSQDQTLKLWDVATRADVLTLTGHDGPVSGVAFSADGAYILSSGWDGTVRIWGQ